VTFERRRQTQTAEYWLQEFAVHEQDVEYLYEWFLEIGEPRGIGELALKTVEHRCHEEEEALSRRSDGGLIYQPVDAYGVGQRLVFPALDYAAGQVLAVRKGNTPRHGTFSVIKVQLDNEEAPREFAAELSSDHVLDDSVLRLQESQNLLSPEQLYELYGQSTRELLEEALLQNKDFVHFDGHWFLPGLMPEVSPYHLNIAEAIVDDHRQPLAISQLLEGFEETDWPSSSNISVRAYALNYAFSQDPRFVDLGNPDGLTWYLRELIPPGARHKPVRLAPMHRAQGGEWLSRELHEFVAELVDQADELERPHVVEPGNGEQVQFYLIYPHRREGSLPLSSQALRMLPERPADRFMVTFLDQRNGEDIAGWMVPGEGYALGLEDWYRRHEVPVGGVLELRQGDAPFTFLISHEKKRRKADWIRQARVLDGRLTFSMQRKALACRHDKHLLIDGGPADALDGLWTNAGEECRSLLGYLTILFPELAKLSGQGWVHAWTLYSAVNLTRRCGAVPIFAELTRQACFDPVGNGNWVYDETLRNVVYETPEEMSRRPKSRCQDLIKDRVDQYGTSNEVWGP